MSDEHISDNKTPNSGRSPVDMSKDDLQNEEDWKDEQSDSRSDSHSDTDAVYDERSFHPTKSKKVWIILTGIFLIIAVAVLYVYQAGDTKTILGNQPIPQSPYAYGTPAAVTTPINIPAQQPTRRPPIDNANELNRAAVLQPIPSQNTNTGQNLVRCPKCSTTGIPVCSSCGSVMKPLSNTANSNLFYCPSCGTVGTPVCPQCGTRMSLCTNSAHLAAAP